MACKKRTDDFLAAIHFISGAANDLLCILIVASGDCKAIKRQKSGDIE